MFFLLHLQGDDSEIKLDFTFDADLAKYAEAKDETEKEDLHDTASPAHMSLGGGNQNMANNPPTSPAAQDLNMKIASVKTVWDIPAMPSSSNVMVSATNVMQGGPNVGGPMQGGPMQGGPNVGNVMQGGPNVGVMQGGPNVGVMQGGPNVGVMQGGPNVGVMQGGPNVGGVMQGGPSVFEQR